MLLVSRRRLVAGGRPLRPVPRPPAQRESGQSAERGHHDLEGLVCSRGGEPSWQGCCRLKVATVWQTRLVGICAK